MGLSVEREERGPTRRILDYSNSSTYGPFSEYRLAVSRRSGCDSIGCPVI
jgi:hypothetical protein